MEQYCGKIKIYCPLNVRNNFNNDCQIFRNLYGLDDLRQLVNCCLVLNATIFNIKLPN